MKKILFIINSLKYRSGTERVACILANLFNEKLHCDVTIINRDTIKKNVAYHLNEQISIEKFNGNYYCFLNKTNDFIAKENPDTIIIYNMGRLSLLCCLLKTSKKITKVITFEHVAFEIRPKWVKLLSKIFYKKIDQVVTLTNRDKKNYNKFHSNVVKINNISPFNVDEHSGEYMIESKKIISIGRLEFQKNFESLLMAWKIVREKNCDWELLIYGTGEKKSSLEKIIIHEKLKNVRLMGETQDVQKVYKEASFFVMSSHFEGLPMVLIEAQSHGLPIVSYDCPHGPAEIIENDENGFLVKNQNPELLAESMLKLISSDTLRSKFSNNARRHASYYSEPEILKDWIKVIN